MTIEMILRQIILVSFSDRCFFQYLRLAISFCDLEMIFCSILFSPGEEIFKVFLNEYFAHVQLHASLSVVIVLVQTRCISWYEQDALELHLRGVEKI